MSYQLPVADDKTEAQSSPGQFLVQLKIASTEIKGLSVVPETVQSRENHKRRLGTKMRNYVHLARWI